MFSITYEELRRLAYSVKRGDPSNTLSPTTLVNEARLRLAESPAIKAESLLHFKRIAGRALRQLLIEAARRRHSHKRGGNGSAIFVTFDESLKGAVTGGQDLLALDDWATSSRVRQPLSKLASLAGWRLARFPPW